MARGKSGKNTSKRTATSQQVKRSTRSHKEACLLSSPLPSPPAVVSGNAKGKGHCSCIESSPLPPTSEQEEEERSTQESEPQGGNSEENNSGNDGMTLYFWHLFYLFISQSSIYSPGA